MSRAASALRLLPPGAPLSADGGPVFLRHPPLPQLQGVCYGRRDDDPPPGAHGLAAQALCAAHPRLLRLPLLSSPARRCRGLAEALCAQAGVGDGATRCDPRLWELDFGAWEGLRWDALPRAALDRWAEDVVGFRPPGGESFRDLVARVDDCLRTLDGPHLIVAHAGVIRAATHLLGGLPLAEAAAVEVPYLQPLRVSGTGDEARSG